MINEELSMINFEEEGDNRANEANRANIRFYESPGDKLDRLTQRAQAGKPAFHGLTREIDGIYVDVEEEGVGRCDCVKDFLEEVWISGKFCQMAD